MVLPAGNGNRKATDLLKYLAQDFSEVSERRSRPYETTPVTGLSSNTIPAPA